MQAQCDQIEMTGLQENSFMFRPWWGSLLGPSCRLENPHLRVFLHCECLCFERKQTSDLCVRMRVQQERKMLCIMGTRKWDDGVFQQAAFLCDWVLACCSCSGKKLTLKGYWKLVSARAAESGVRTCATRQAQCAEFDVIRGKIRS